MFACIFKRFRNTTAAITGIMSLAMNTTIHQLYSCFFLNVFHTGKLQTDWLLLRLFLLHERLSYLFRSSKKSCRSRSTYIFITISIQDRLISPTLLCSVFVSALTHLATRYLVPLTCSWILFTFSSCEMVFGVCLPTYVGYRM